MTFKAAGFLEGMKETLEIKAKNHAQLDYQRNYLAYNIEVTQNLDVMYRENICLDRWSLLFGDAFRLGSPIFTWRREKRSEIRK